MRKSKVKIEQQIYFVERFSQSLVLTSIILYCFSCFTSSLETAIMLLNTSSSSKIYQDTMTLIDIGEKKGGLLTPTKSPIAGSPLAIGFVSVKKTLLALFT